MRWKLIRRRLSVSAPRMIVRSHLPWPIRWVIFALALGFSAAVALWAFEFGKDIAGLRPAGGFQAQSATELKDEIEKLRAERDQAQSIANTADSLLKAEHVTQTRLAAQLKALESENLALKNDLGFFERLLPAGSSQGIAVRALQAELAGPGRLRFQLLVMQQGRNAGEFNGRYEMTLVGTLDSKPWTQPVTDAARPLQFKQYKRVEGTLAFPAQAVVTQVQVRVVDQSGGVRASHTATL
ncbi:MAG TPA: DUF6776 family protein [Burkholderiaceae bacterium]|nr:DUF6776 family protein [Burkholderiaceae bacterium]